MKKKKKVQNRKKKKEPVGKARLAARIASVTLVLLIVACCAVGDWFVHHPREWLDAHRAFYTAPLWYFGNRTAMVTDALGWTGHDAVYEFDEAAPSNQVFFAGAPERTGEPAPKDIVTLNRGQFAIGWSPSLRHPVWAAYHVVKDARFDALKRPNFQKDRSVSSSPSPGDYARSGYDRGHVVPNRAIVTRYGEIWVIVGAVSPAAGRKTLENTTIDVPDQYYMLVVAQDDEGVRALAVMLPQTAEVDDFPVHGIVTVNELEAATGLRFFPDMPKFLARPLKADRPTRLWPIRLRDLVKLLLLRFT